MFSYTRPADLSDGVLLDNGLFFLFLSVTKNIFSSVKNLLELASVQRDQSVN